LALEYLALALGNLYVGVDSITSRQSPGAGQIFGPEATLFLGTLILVGSVSFFALAVMIHLKYLRSKDAK
jgi:hypothetical protein